ncbi:hypothetical protein [Yinghuangia aomiensis]
MGRQPTPWTLSGPGFTGWSARGLDELVDRAEDQARRLEEIRVGVVSDPLQLIGRG